MAKTLRKGDLWWVVLDDAYHVVRAGLVRIDYADDGEFGASFVDDTDRIEASQRSAMNGRRRVLLTAAPQVVSHQRVAGIGGFVSGTSSREVRVRWLQQVKKPVKLPEIGSYLSDEERASAENMWT